MNKKMIAACAIGLLLTACFEYEESRDINAVPDEGKINSDGGASIGAPKGGQDPQKDRGDGGDGVIVPDNDNSGPVGSAPGAPGGQDKEPGPKPPVDAPPSHAFCLSTNNVDYDFSNVKNDLQMQFGNILRDMKSRNSDFSCIYESEKGLRNTPLGDKSGEYLILLNSERDDGKFERGNTDDKKRGGEFDKDREYETVRVTLSCASNEPVVFYTVDACNAKDVSPVCVTVFGGRNKLQSEFPSVTIPLVYKSTLLVIDGMNEQGMKNLGNFEDCKLTLSRQEGEIDDPDHIGD